MVLMVMVEVALVMVEWMAAITIRIRGLEHLLYLRVGEALGQGPEYQPVESMGQCSRFPAGPVSRCRVGPGSRSGPCAGLGVFIENSH